MSEQHEHMERRVREALVAEGREAPAPQDLWARVERRLERPVPPSIGWQRRWRIATMGAVVALLLAMGGGGTALVASGLSWGSEDRAWLALSFDDARTDERLSDVGGWIDVRLDDESDSSLAIDSVRNSRTRFVTAGFTVDPELAEEEGVPGPPGPPGAAGPAQPAAQETASAVPAPAQSSGGSPQGLVGERQIISQASLDLQVSDVNAATVQLRGLVQSFGGFIEHVSMSGGPNPEHGSAVVRVPSDRFLDALESIERLGKALGQSLGQRDVTGEAIDLEARLKSGRSAEESLLKLLERAVSVSDVLTVERELARVRADIERFQGQLEFIQRSVALATIAVSFVLPPGSIPVAPSASLQLEVDDVEQSVGRVRDLVGGAGGTMGEVIVTTRQESEDAFLSFLVPASAFDSTLASLVGDGVVLRREVQSDGRLHPDEGDEGLQATVTVLLQTPDNSFPWGSIGALVAGGLLIVLSVVGALVLVFRARRRRA
ncbi:MAG: DUF4349 domain-containing protein [Chloroflexota bacterium]|nr:DUF4349 domain-containing protein [Chloroflexota bacterium]